MQANNNIWAFLNDLASVGVIPVQNAGAPVSGTSGTGVGLCGPGTLLMDITNTKLYINTNTLASPTWTLIASVTGLTGDVTVSSTGVVTIGAGAVTATKIAANTITSAQISVDVIQKVKVNILSAAIKTLRATPVTIVAAQGAGKIIEIIGGSAQLLYGGTNAFTGAQNLSLKPKDGTGTALANLTGTGWLDQTASEHQEFAFPAGAINPKANMDNQPIVLHNTGAAEITGNAAGDNTMDVEFLYRVLTKVW